MTNLHNAAREALNPKETAKQLQHCAIAVSDWLAGGCDVHDIPRFDIAALVAWTKKTAALSEAPGESVTRVQWLRELLDSVMTFRPEGDGMVRGGPYVRADSLLQAAEVAAARAETPTVALTEADVMRLWHEAAEARRRRSAYEWFKAGIRATERAHRIGKEGGA